MHLQRLKSTDYTVLNPCHPATSDCPPCGRPPLASAPLLISGRYKNDLRNPEVGSTLKDKDKKLAFHDMYENSQRDLCCITPSKIWR